jgi:anti-anti-sigma factor
MNGYLVQHLGDILLIRLKVSVLVAGECRKLERQISDELRKTTRAVIDLDKLNYFDSSGLGVIVRWAEHCRASGIDLRISNSSRVSCALLELAQVVDMIPVYESLDEALRSFERVPATVSIPARTVASPGA